MIKSQKKLYIILFVTLFIVVIGGITTMTKIGKQQQKEVVANSVRTFDELTVKIGEYEEYYRDKSFRSKEMAEYYSFSGTVHMYALFYYFEKIGMTWDEEKRGLARSYSQSAIDYDLTLAHLAPYYEKMFRELNITKDDYIDHYLMVKKEYEAYDIIRHNEQIGYDEEGQQEMQDTFDEYYQLIGVSENDLKFPHGNEANVVEPLNPQPKLPFPDERNQFQVGLDKNGDYVFVNLSWDILFNERYIKILGDIKNYNVRDDLTRVSLPAFVEVINTYESADAKEQQLIQELIEFFKIFERTAAMGV